MKEKNEIIQKGIETDLAPWFSALKNDLKERDPDLAAQKRDHYFQSVMKIKTRNYRSGISGLSPNILAYFKNLWMRMPKVLTVLIALFLLLGSSSATVYAAQKSEPEQALYGVKIFSEKIQMVLTSDPEVKFALNLHFSRRRMLEMVSLIEKEKEIPIEVITSWDQHFQSAINLASKMELKGNSDTVKDFVQELQVQEKLLVQFKSETSMSPLIFRLQTRLRWCGETLNGEFQDPVQLRNQDHGNKNQEIEIPKNDDNESSANDNRSGVPFCNQCLCLDCEIGSTNDESTSDVCVNCVVEAEKTGFEIEDCDCCESLFKELGDTKDCVDCGWDINDHPGGNEQCVNCDSNKKGSEERNEGPGQGSGNGNGSDPGGDEKSKGKSGNK